MPDAFRSMDDLVLMPCRGSATLETTGRMTGLCLAKRESYFPGKGPLTPAREMRV